MNKLFSKIAALSVGLAMAVGVGVALGHQSVREAKAADYAELECDFTKKTTSHGSYNDSWDYGDDFTIHGGANNNGGWAYAKMGGKKATLEEEGGAGNPVYIQTKTASIKAISKVTVNVLANTGSNTSKMGATWKLYVASDADFKTVIDTVDKGSLTITSANLYTFVPTSGDTWAAGSYFKVEWTCSNTSTTNGIVWLNNVKTIYSVSVATPDTVTVSGDKNALVVGESTTLTSECTKSGSVVGVNQNVVWSSLDETKAFVSQIGVVTGVGNGSVTIRATAEDDSTIYGEYSITVSGGKVNDSAIAITPSDLPTAYGDNYVVIGGAYLHVKQVMENGGVIQIQKTNGLVENVAAFEDEIKTIELSFNAEKVQGSGFAVKVSADGESYSTLQPSEIYTKRFEYTCSLANAAYFMITAPTSGTLYLDEILVGFGNSTEVKLVTLAAALNDLLDSECTGSSDTNPITAAKWAEVKAAYDGGDSDAKSALADVASLSYVEVNQFLSRYDHIVSSYGYSNFLNREIPAQAHFVGFDGNNSSYIIIIVISAVSVMSFGLALFLRKKRSK